MLDSILAAAAGSTYGVPCRQTLSTTLTDEKYEEIQSNDKLRQTVTLNLFNHVKSVVRNERAGNNRAV